MNLTNAIVIGFKEIWAHKFRSLLTMLGIILGVSSLVAMSALIKGMENGMKEALIAIGGLAKIRVEPQEVPVEQRHLQDQAVGITLNDVQALRHNATLVSHISPEMRIYGATITGQGKTYRPWNCSGAWPVALELSEHVVEHGRMFNALDEEMARNVCVIGTATRDEIFGAPDVVGREIVPVGEIISINGQPFTIIGMFKRYESESDRKRRELTMAQSRTNIQSGPSRSRGWSGRGGGFAFMFKNASVYIPLNTMWVKFRASGGGGRRGGGGGGGGGGVGRVVTSSLSDPNIPDPRLSVLELKITDVERMSEALQQIRNILMSTHKGIEDFNFRTQEEWAENITQFIKNARLSGGMIAAISLLVGGIGIMNIMLASISERIREIGIRKAVGAWTGDVFIQILVESVVIAVLGGLMGVAFSFGLVHLIQSFTPTDNTPVVTLAALVVAFLFSVGVGICAGLFPAVKAARLDPITALRYE
jgi:putative ABC transport system permease protein